MGINERDSKELEKLAKLLRNNTATEADYNKYLELIDSYGLKKERIIEKMKEYGFNDWQSYKDARIKIKNNNDAKREERRPLEVELLGYILAFELAAGFNPIREEESKNPTSKEGNEGDNLK